MASNFHEMRTERVQPLRPWWQRHRLALAALLLAPPLLVLLAHLALNSASAAQAIRARALDKLQRRLGPCTLGPEVSVGWLGEAQLGPLAIPAGPGEPPLLRVEQLRVRPSLRALLSGAVEPASATLERATLRTDRRGQRLRAFVARVRALPHAEGGGKATGPRTLALALRDAWVEVEPDADEDAADPARLGPVQLEVELKPSSGAQGVDARLQLGDEGWARAGATLRPGEAQLELEAQGLPLAPLGALGPKSLAVQGGRLSGSALVHAGQGEVEAKVEGWVTGLVVSGERLASEPVGPATLGYRGSLRAARAARSLTANGALLLGADRVEVPFEASVSDDDELSYQLDARLGPEQLARLIAALPPQLVPGPEAPQVDGPLRAELRAAGPLRKPSDWTVEVKLDTTALKEQARAQPCSLREPFAYHPRDPAGAERTLWLGERNPDFAPLSQLPAWVPMAVVVSEDAGFYSHPGFDFDEIRESLAAAAGGARLRGGSTLTQQLVKNLYLTRERTLARKAREALITLEVEAALPKARILELYLNLIEWGPGIYGVGEAARYYFGVDARQLTPKQAVFLASIIPNPPRFGPWLKKGGLTDFWAKRLETLLGRLKERGAIDDAQYQQALGEPMGFRE